MFFWFETPIKQMKKVLFSTFFLQASQVKACIFIIRKLFDSSFQHTYSLADCQVRGSYKI